MKILFASHSASLLGGSERSLVEIAGWLAARPGVTVVVAVPGTGPLSEELQQRSLDVAVLPYDWCIASDGHAAVRRSLDGLPAVLAFVADLAPDVIVTNTSVIPWFGVTAARLGIPHAWFLREDVTADIGIAYHPSAWHALQTIGRFSDSLFVNSRYIQSVYAAALRRQDIHVVYPTFPAAVLDSRYLRPRILRPGSAVAIIVYGIVLPAKNQSEALEAARILQAQGVQFTMTIMGGVGSRAYYDSLVTFVHEHALDDVVRFLPHRDVPYDVVADHDICVVPSIAEPFGRVTVEAMALGKVVVAADAGGHREILEPASDAGFRYPPGRPDQLASLLARLIAQPEGFHAVGRRAREHAVRSFFERDSMADLYGHLTELARRDKRPDPDCALDAAYRLLD